MTSATIGVNPPCRKATPVRQFARAYPKNTRSKNSPTIPGTEGGKIMSGGSVLEHLVIGSVEKILKEHRQAMKAWDVEDAVAFFINTYKMILDADKRSHDRAVKDPSYPYKAKQEALKRAITTVVKATDKLLSICEIFEKDGYKIKDKDKLEPCRDAFANTDKLFESFYASADFEEIHKEAIKEYKAGKTEDWP
ncbi:MAG: hypothetical protein ACK4WF_07650 [Candidatus Brocadiales bacterium]